MVQVRNLSCGFDLETKYTRFWGGILWVNVYYGIVHFRFYKPPSNQAYLDNFWVMQIFKKLKKYLKSKKKVRFQIMFYS